MVVKEADNPDRLLVTLSVSELREIVREEIEALKLNANGPESITLLDLKQAAEQLKLPKSRITQAVKQGDLACVRVGHYLRFSPSDLEEFIFRHKEKKA